MQYTAIETSAKGNYKPFLCCQKKNNLDVSPTIRLSVSNFETKKGKEGHKPSFDMIIYNDDSPTISTVLGTEIVIVTRLNDIIRSMILHILTYLDLYFYRIRR